MQVIGNCEKLFERLSHPPHFQNGYFYKVSDRECGKTLDCCVECSHPAT